MKKTLAVNGSFYPDNCEDLQRYIKHFNSLLKEIDKIPIKALISPHAGYIYSGFSANIGYNFLNGYKNIAIIGPSHRVYLDHISISKYDIYPSPCKDMQINKNLIDILEKKFDFIHFNPKAHYEHSTETQVPFIAHYAPEAKIIELVYGRVDYIDVAKVIKYLINNNILTIISTDLSHFYNQTTANKLDNICLKAIEKLDTDILDSGCEACGIIGLKALLKVAKELNLNSKILDYRTSGDITKDYDRVVGYTSAILFD